jgi:hypothetical protein
MDEAEEAQLSEDPEAYEIDVIDPTLGLVLGTLEAAAEVAILTAAQQLSFGVTKAVMSDDCTGAFGANLTEDSAAGASASFYSNVLSLYSPSSSAYAGANATAKVVLNRAGRTIVSTRWHFHNYVSTDVIGNNALDVMIHKSSPTFSTAAWAYHRPEHGVGANSYILLGHYIVSSAIWMKCIVNVSGTASTVFSINLGAAFALTWHDVVLVVDWSAHTISLYIDGALSVAAQPFSSGLDTPITSSLQVTWHCNAYGGNSYMVDDLSLAHNPAGGVYPVIVDIYQLSAAVGRGYPRRANI